MPGNVGSRAAKKNSLEEPASTELQIEYPREEELIIPGHYAIRIAGSPEAQVEISINDGEWHGCRTAVGYYWFDWEPSDAGEVTIVARQRVGKGRPKKSSARFCRIVKKVEKKP